MVSIDSLSSLTVPQGVEGIIFDYGGTLDSRGDHWSQVILDAYRETGFDISIDAFVDAYVYAERTLAASPSTISPKDTFHDLMRKKIAIQMGCLYNAGDIELSDMPFSTLIAELCYDRARECVTESAATLRRLAETYPLALVTNFYGNINAVLEDFAIRKYFKAVIESATAGVRKPEPEIFRLALNALGLPADRTLVVGDSLGKDIIPAETIGCHTALLKGRPWPPK
ncbi:MAG: HAD family hydrolase [Bacteroides sp.]|nr:HAD family hydrolase [Bacteroides sp.]